MEVLDRTAELWAVVDTSTEVVVMASGGDAAGFVEEWVARGFRAVRLAVTDVHAA